MTDTQACMGGWCTRRDHCSNFHAEDRRDVAERLCSPGHDGEGADLPVRVHRPAGTWERTPGLMVEAGVWDVLG